MDSLEVQPRTIMGKKVQRLRREGLLPLTLYGKGFAPVSAQVDERVFQTVYRHAGRSSMIEVTMPGMAKQSAFVHVVQRHPVSRKIIHADLHVVDPRQEMTLEIPINFIGESPLAKQGDGVVNHAINMIVVHGLPAKVPQHIDVDVSVLDAFDKNIHLRDIPLPEDKSYTFVGDLDGIIASIAPVRSAATETDTTSTAVAAAAEPEVIARKDKDEE